eukprot:9483140-Pyramimonas_sp.AAC.1
MEWGLSEFCLLAKPRGPPQRPQECAPREGGICWTAPPLLIAAKTASIRPPGFPGGAPRRPQKGPARGLPKNAPRGCNFERPKKRVRQRTPFLFMDGL